MTPRHHLNDLGLILWSSIFHHFSWFSPSVPMFGMIPSFPWNKVDTILKYVENHYNSNQEWFIWWRLAIDNLSQKGSDLPKWRNPLWPLWRPPVTWRRVLRTTSADLSRCVWTLQVRRPKSVCLNTLNIDVFISFPTEGHLGRMPGIFVSLNVYSMFWQECA